MISIVSRIFPHFITHQRTRIRHQTKPIIQHFQQFKRMSQLSSSASIPSSPSTSPPSISLSPEETRLFNKVLSCCESLHLPVQIRVAGGWVRDKLLGLSSSDIDFALDSMTGAQFSTAIQQYLISIGESTSSVGLIKLNPLQSKHLETATFKIDGISIDVNNFRKEIYHEESRIPEVELSSAQEDALRRDFTVNSLFYNIHTNCIEDYCNGINDFNSRLLKTPRPPQQTFLDDPLRVLRAARFAGRFQFQVDPQIELAAKSIKIQDAIRKKITRERIGQEIQKILDKPHTALFSFLLLYQWKLRCVIFQVSESIEKLTSKEIHGIDEKQIQPIETIGQEEIPLLTQRCVNSLEFAHRLRLHKFTNSSQFSGPTNVHMDSAPFDDEINKLYQSNTDSAQLLILSCILHPYFGYQSPLPKGRPISLIQYIIRNSLKLPIRHSDQTYEIIQSAHKINQLALQHSMESTVNHPSIPFHEIPLDQHSFNSKKLYLSAANEIRSMKELFFVAFDLARIMNAIDGDRVQIESLIHYQTSLYRSPLIRDRVWELRPMLNGRELQIVLKVPAGPQLAGYIEFLLNWQILHLNRDWPGRNAESDKETAIKELKIISLFNSQWKQ